MRALPCRFGSFRNYREIANDSIATLAMIETRKAIDNLHKIVAVKGLDAVFIGTFNIVNSSVVLERNRLLHPCLATPLHAVHRCALFLLIVQGRTTWR